MSGTRTMDVGVFAHEVSGTSRTLGRNHDLKIVFQGDKAMTTGDVIVFPSLPTEAKLETREQMIMRGYVDHEAAHNRHTDMALGAKFQSECKAARDQVSIGFMQAIEDVRIERLTIKEYPGAKKNLDAVACAVDDAYIKMHEKDASISTEIAKIGSVAITWEGRRRAGYGDGERALDTLPPDIRKAVERWTDATEACRSTADTIELARIIGRKLSDGTWNDTDWVEEFVRSHGGDDGGEGGRRGPGEGEGDDYTAGSGELTDGKAEGRGGGKGSGGDRPPVDMDTPPMDLTPDKAMNEVLKPLLPRSNGKEWRPLSTAHDKVHHRLDPRGKYVGADGRDFTLGQKLARGSATHVHGLLKSASGRISVMRRKLELMLLAKMNRDWDPVQEQGRLDTRRLVAASRGVPHVFKTRAPMPEMDTAVSMMIDLSGSMCGRAHLAQDVAIILADCLERVGCAIEVLGFNNSTGFLKDIPRPSRSGIKYSRSEPLDIYVFKDFGEKMREANRSMAAIAYMANGNNSDPDAIYTAWHRLRKRREARRILLVLSDGSPACHTDFDERHLNMHTRAAVQRVEADGIPCIGIGIQDTSVKQFYPRYAIVRDLNDLGKSTLDQMGKCLLGDRFKVDNAELNKAVSREAA